MRAAPRSAYAVTERKKHLLAVDSIQDQSESVKEEREIVLTSRQ